MSTDLRLCVDFGTALSKAAVANPAMVQPLALGRAVGQPSPLFLPCALFIDGGCIHFGANAWSEAEHALGERRELMSSFKSIFSDHDLERAVELLPPRELDPTGQFRRRDLLTIFLAWLLHALDGALIDNGMSVTAGRDLPIRFTSPVWSGAERSATYRTVAGLFGDARTVADELGPLLAAETGLEIDRALRALEKGRARPATGSIVEGVAFEAVAAAACHRSDKTIRHLMVFDMGAGTTDIAGLRLDQKGVTEIREARQTVMTAGDDIDMLLLEVFLSNARRLRSTEAKSSLWRRAALQARMAKKSLFEDGRAAIMHEGRPVSAKLSDLTGRKDFKTLRDSLRDTFEAKLDVVAAQARFDGAKTVHVMLAGGGANLPFVREMAARAKARRGVKPVVLPLTPDWAHHPRFGGNLAPIFPQMAISLGGAVAPRSLLFTPHGAPEREPLSG